MKTLLILRHAKSSWSDASLDDHERPLNQRGLRDAPRIGEFIRTHKLLPDLIISSDAVRARATAEAVAKAARFEGDVQLEPRFYGASPTDILAVLRSLRDAKAAIVLIVGHNPTLEGLIAQLSGESLDLPTAALAQIDLPIDRWRDLKETIRGSLVNVWRPREL
jgi:phosphohistidine phosphatase